MGLIRFGKMRGGFLCAATVVALAACAYGVWIYRLPNVRDCQRSNSDELVGKRWKFPDESGFWVQALVEPRGVGHPGGYSKVTWMAKEGLMPVQCAQLPNFHYCWGQRLSTIEGGDWNVDPRHYEMSGRLYYWYEVVPKGTPGSILDGGQSVLKVGATCAGVYRLIH